MIPFGRDRLGMNEFNPPPKKTRSKRKPKPLVDVFTVKRDALIRMAAVNSRDLPHLIDDGSRRKRWVGIGWVDEGPADGTEVLVVE